jgi:threonine dehydrogenase-like Zn-dependent dehydrogenase
MLTKSVVFTAPKTAEVLTQEVKPVTDDLVAVRMEYTVVSGGTERANIMAMPNAGGGKFPKQLGYCGIGHVIEVGDRVTTVRPGDRVLVYHGKHTEINVVPEIKVTKVTQEGLDSVEAAFVIIAAMGLGGVRRLQFELGESGMVMGLGLLGMFAMQFMRLSGVYPVIAADLNPARRALALELGADFALDPAEEGFTDKLAKARDMHTPLCARYDNAGRIVYRLVANLADDHSESPSSVVSVLRWS